MVIHRILRFAPSHAGIQIANTWRVWTQGDQFYAATRDTSTFSKISFHSNGNWQDRSGSQMRKLGKGLKLSDDWIHALQIVHVVTENAVTPKVFDRAATTLLETPSGFASIFDLAVSIKSRAIESEPPFELQGTVFRRFGLKSGQVLLAIGRKMPFTSDHDQFAKEMKGRVRINLSAEPVKSDLYAEAKLHSYEHEGGNVILITPLSFKAFKTAN